MKPLMNFTGVFTKYLLQKPKTVPAGLIVNTDTIFGKGKHWCAMYWDENNRLYYFDPLADLPFKEWITFMMNNSSSFEIDSVYAVQPDYSIKCGQYCCLFLLKCFYCKNFHNVDKRLIMCNVNENNVKEMLLYIANNKQWL